MIKKETNDNSLRVFKYGTGRLTHIGNKRREKATLMTDGEQEKSLRRCGPT